MAATGYDIREHDPFATEIKIHFSNRIISPYVNRMRILWEEMRNPIIERFPKPPRYSNQC